jgi:hypothetical protein
MNFVVVVVVVVVVVATVYSAYLPVVQYRILLLQE